jgi:hypothetical protein
MGVWVEDTHAVAVVLALRSSDDVFEKLSHDSVTCKVGLNPSVFAC